MRVTWRYGMKRAHTIGTAPKKPVPWYGELWGVNTRGERVVQSWRSPKPITLAETIDVMHALVDEMVAEIGREGADAGWWVACR